MNFSKSNLKHVNTQSELKNKVSQVWRVSFLGIIQSVRHCKNDHITLWQIIRRLLVPLRCDKVSGKNRKIISWTLKWRNDRKLGQRKSWKLTKIEFGVEHARWLVFCQIRLHMDHFGEELATTRGKVNFCYLIIRFLDLFSCVSLVWGLIC